MSENTTKLGDLIRDKGPEIVEAVGGFVDVVAEKTSAAIEAGKEKGEITKEQLARKFAETARAAANKAETIAEEARQKAADAAQAAAEAEAAADAAEAALATDASDTGDDGAEG